MRWLGPGYIVVEQELQRGEEGEGREAAARPLRGHGTHGEGSVPGQGAGDTHLNVLVESVHGEILDDGKQGGHQARPPQAHRVDEAQGLGNGSTGVRTGVGPL